MYPQTPLTTTKKLNLFASERIKRLSEGKYLFLYDANVGNLLPPNPMPPHPKRECGMPPQGNAEWVMVSYGLRFGGNDGKRRT